MLACVFFALPAPLPYCVIHICILVFKSVMFCILVRDYMIENWFRHLNPQVFVSLIFLLKHKFEHSTNVFTRFIGWSTSGLGVLTQQKYE